MRAANGVGSSRVITHKELLTFNNLTNLEWEFAEIRATDENGDVLTGKGEEYLPLDELLNPELFVRYNSEEDVYFYSYVEGEFEEERPLTDEERKKGLAEMRQEAGIAMEYLEKWQKWQKTDRKEGTDEGRFLGEWEVIYGADNYKIVADLLDDMYGDNVDYPSREKAKDKEEALQTIETTMKLMDLGVQTASVLIPHYISFGANGYEPLINTGLKGVTSEVGKTFTKEGLKGSLKAMREEISEGLAQKGSKYAMSAIFNQGSIITYDVISMAKKKVGTELTQEQLDELEKTYNKISQLGESEELAEYEVEVTFNHKISMFDTGLKVLVLKKDKEIVITYKLPEERRKEEMLPEEIELIDIVYQRIAKEYSEEEGYNIIFTGYEGGGDLSLVSSLRYDKPASIFSIQPKNLKGILDFTEKDIAKDHKNSNEILIDTGEGVAKGAAATIIFCSIFMGGTALPVALLDIFIGAVLNLLIECVEHFEIKRILEILKSKPLEYVVRKEHKGLNGYITDSYRDQEIVKFTLDEKEINVKKSDVLYFLIKQGRLPELKVQNNESKDKYYFSSIEPGIGVSYYHKLVLGKDKEKDYFKIVKKETEVTYQSSSYTGVPKSTHKTEEFSDKEGLAFENLLDIISKLQRNYINQDQTIETIYYDIKNRTVSITNDFLELSQEGEAIDIRPNEFVFMPFLDSSGNISSKKPKLRDEYIASVLKSVIQKYKEYDSFNINDKAVQNESVYDSDIQNYYNARKDVKYGLKDDYSQEYIIDYVHDFGEKITADIVKDEFLKILKDLSCAYGYTNMFFDRSSKLIFNHYRAILKRLDEDPDILKDCYKIKTQEEELLFLKEISGTITLNPSAKSSIEYKYNPADYIIGGELELYAKPEKEIDKEKVNRAKENVEEEIEETKEELISAITTLKMMGEKGQKMLEKAYNNASEETKEKLEFLKNNAPKVYDHTLDKLKAKAEDLQDSGELDKEKLLKENSKGKSKNVKDFEIFNNIRAH